MSKGSNRRPQQITAEQWAERWTRTFEAPEPEPDVDNSCAPERRP